MHTIVGSDAHSYTLENGQVKKYYELQKVNNVQNLDTPAVGLTREQMSKDKTVKRGFKQSGLNAEDIVDTVRPRKPIKKLNL